jgi:predicted peptidase
MFKYAFIPGITLILLAGCSMAEPTRASTLTPSVESPATETPIETSTPQITPTVVQGIGIQSVSSVELAVGDLTESHDYLVYLPENYLEQESWPLIIYLHGAGARGDNIYQVQGDPFHRGLGLSRHLPAIVISPQSPRNTHWAERLPILNAFLDEIIETYPIDTNRIYLTGFSMGGLGSWSWGMANPERFAAIAPTGGFAYGYTDICNLKNTNVWAFASKGDEVVSAASTTILTEALEECGSQKVNLTIYEDANHLLTGTWPYLQNDDLFEWLWEQSLAVD